MGDSHKDASIARESTTVELYTVLQIRNSLTAADLQRTTVCKDASVGGGPVTSLPRLKSAINKQKKVYALTLQ